MIKILFWLPLVVFNMIIPINQYTYKPSTEEERILSEQLHNEIRLKLYKLKKEFVDF